MKKLIVILSFLLIISNAYSYHSDLYQETKKGRFEFSDTTYKDTGNSVKPVKELPGKAVKNNKTRKDSPDIKEYEKDHNSESVKKDTVIKAKADSSVFISFVKKVTARTHITNECTVITLSGKFYKDVRITGLSDSTLKIYKNSKSKEILLKDISSVKIEGRGFWKGALLGSGGGLLIGFIAGNLDTTGEYLWDGMKLGMALALPLAIVGGIFESKDTVYDMRAMDIKRKKKELKYIFRYY